MSESCPSTRVLLVDDDRAFAGDLAEILAEKYLVKCEHSGSDAVKQARAQRPDLVLLDIDLGSEPNGFTVLEMLQSGKNPPPVIMLTGTRKGDTAAVVRAMKAGAEDYMNKPPNVVALLQKMEKCLIIERSRIELRALREKVRQLEGKSIWEDRASLELLSQVDRVAPTDMPILITGETGTGKEVLANEIHRRSKRAAGPFVARNCFMFSEQLSHSEIVGHRKGSFTGATTDRKGALAKAEDGTLFLDEIGCASKEIQGQLLRVLEEHKYIPLGSDTDISANIRLVSATNEDLSLAMTEGRFRQDLFYRLGAITLHLLPLRERKGDIVPLAEFFRKKYAAKEGRRVIGFSDSAKDVLLEHRWEGNIRELKHLIWQAVVFCDSEVIKLGDLYAGPQSQGGLSGSYDEAKEQIIRNFKMNFFLPRIRQAGGDAIRAAKTLGMPSNVFKRHLKDAGINLDDFKNE